MWARKKGLDLIGTGDLTHPVWRDELREKLEPAQEGLYKPVSYTHLDVYKRQGYILIVDYIEVYLIIFITKLKYMIYMLFPLFY